MNTAKQISEVLKANGLGFVKMQKDYYTEVSYKNWRGKMVKGVKGGSTGPMTATSQHSIHTNKAISKVVNGLTDNLTGVTLKDQGELVDIIIPTSKGVRVVTFVAIEYPTYHKDQNLDNCYKTMWWTYSHRDYSNASAKEKGLIK